METLNGRTALVTGSLAANAGGNLTPRATVDANLLAAFCVAPRRS